MLYFRWQWTVSVQGGFLHNYGPGLLKSVEQKSKEFQLDSYCTTFSSKCPMPAIVSGGEDKSISQSISISRQLLWCEQPRTNPTNSGLMSLVSYRQTDCWNNHQRFSELEIRPNIALQLAELPHYMWDDTPRKYYCACAIIKRRDNSLDVDRQGRILQLHIWE